MVLQEVQGNSSSPGTSQSSQVVEHEDPHQILGTSAPQQKINVKHNIKSQNSEGGDGTNSIFLDPFNVFENAVKTPLPMLTDADTWAPLIWPSRTRFEPLGYSDPSIMLSSDSDALSFVKHHSVVGARMDLSLGRPNTDQQGREVTLTIDTRITIKATQNPRPNYNTNPVCLLLHLLGTVYTTFKECCINVDESVLSVTK